MKLPFKGLIRNRKGGASVAVALIMSMMVISSFIQNILVWDDLLRSEDRDRLNEEVEIESITIDINDSVIGVTVKNVGEVPTHLVSLWINDTRYSIDCHLDIEEVKADVGKDLTLDPIPNANNSQVFSVFTERGNSDTTTYILTEEGFQKPLWEVGVTGVFKVDWFYSKFTSQRFPEERDAIMISKWYDLYVAFYVNVTNQWNYPCTITEDSFITLTSLSQIGATEEPIFYIVRNVTYGDNPVLTQYQDSDPYTVYPNSSRTLIFAAYDRWENWKYGGTWNDWKWGPKCPTQASGTEGAGIQISLFYYNSTSMEQVYGQTISTQALILLDDK